MNDVYIIGIVDLILIGLSAMAAYDAIGSFKAAQKCYEDYMECLQYEYLLDLAPKFKALQIGNYILCVMFLAVPVLVGVVLLIAR